jgi:maleylacetoacetate isomerase/maleylpyruvate isomerase
MPFKLHSMWRATAPYRVRIGLELKGLSFDYAPLDFASGEQRGTRYSAINPQMLSPTLEAGGRLLTQSLAILEWLDETHPTPPLLPSSPDDRAVVRAMADIVACDIHPLNNLRVLQALQTMGHAIGSDDQKAWGARWIEEGFLALEAMVQRHGGGFAFGASPTLADCLLIPQLWSANRFGVERSAYPALAAVYDRAAEHPAFQAAHPERQPDA